ncbi:MAG: helix-turn-helix transcriptional regulator [Stigonema ocellatum SAG 48.90 = DSM 106950]|nr:helix-turn-helix transcriptional regulator [Stigonema ocellatum SAG 48.90 = DSM 106950]
MQSLALLDSIQLLEKKQVPLKEKMEMHQEVLITAIKNSGMTAREIAAAAGVHESTLSKFLDGKNDLKAGNYFKILSVLPEAQRLKARLSLGIVVDNFPDEKRLQALTQMIELASDDEMEAALFAIGRKWKQSIGSRSAVGGSASLIRNSTETLDSAIAV